MRYSVENIWVYKTPRYKKGNNVWQSGRKAVVSAIPKGAAYE